MPSQHPSKRRAVNGPMHATLQYSTARLPRHLFAPSAIAYPGPGGLCLVRLQRSRRFVAEASSAHWARTRTAWRCSHEEINTTDLPGHSTMNHRDRLVSPMSDHRMRAQCSAAGPDCPSLALPDISERMAVYLRSRSRSALWQWRCWIVALAVQCCHHYDCRRPAQPQEGPDTPVS